MNKDLEIINYEFVEYPHYLQEKYIKNIINENINKTPNTNKKKKNIIITAEIFLLLLIFQVYVYLVCAVLVPLLICFFYSKTFKSMLLMRKIKNSQSYKSLTHLNQNYCFYTYKIILFLQNNNKTLLDVISEHESEQKYEFFETGYKIYLLNMEEYKEYATKYNEILARLKNDDKVDDESKNILKIFIHQNKYEKPDFKFVAISNGKRYEYGEEVLVYKKSKLVQELKKLNANFVDDISNEVYSLSYYKSFDRLLRENFEELFKLKQNLKNKIERYKEYKNQYNVLLKKIDEEVSDLYVNKEIVRKVEKEFFQSHMLPYPNLLLIYADHENTRLDYAEMKQIDEKYVEQKSKLVQELKKLNANFVDDLKLEYANIIIEMKFSCKSRISLEKNDFETLIIKKIRENVDYYREIYSKAEELINKFTIYEEQYKKLDEYQILKANFSDEFYDFLYFESIERSFYKLNKLPKPGVSLQVTKVFVSPKGHSSGTNYKTYEYEEFKNCYLQAIKPVEVKKTRNQIEREKIEEEKRELRKKQIEFEEATKGHIYANDSKKNVDEEDAQNGNILSIEKQLDKIKKEYDSGKITYAEYKKKRMEIL